MEYNLVQPGKTGKMDEDIFVEVDIQNQTVLGSRERKVETRSRRFTQSEEGWEGRQEA